jgi:4-amino-4-deoxy-L-arabinose transferase-like glycosyltransferase
MNEMTPGLHGRRETTLHIIILAVITVACLLPFINKAYHIDDTLFVWIARNILDKPFDFYGFSVHWGDNMVPMSEVTKNPPIASYYTALAALVAGFGERALHVAFFLPAIGFTTGVYVLARRFTSMPFQAALAAAFTPVFFVSATTVMSDVMMLAFWCWAVVFWLRGSERDEPLMMLFASVLIALSALTKYFGVSLIPLLAVYSLLKGYSIRRWAPWMAVPIAILAGYQWVTHEMYGKGLFLDAVYHVGLVQTIFIRSYLNKASIGLSFVGGCVITALFYAPLLWSRRTLVMWTAGTIVVGFVLVRFNLLEEFFLPSWGVKGVLTMWVSVQFVIFVVAGINLLAISLADLLRRRDAQSVFLFLWIIGTFFFAGFVNWTNNGRSILPMVPVAGILLMRSIEDRYGPSDGTGGWRVLLPLVPALVLSFMVAKADYALANSARTAAAYINEEYAAKGRLWFQGHWGFQYYMEEAGAEPIDWYKTPLKIGDLIVVPTNNTSIRQMPGSQVLLIEEKWFDASEWATTMNSEVGASFYDSLLGPLPYAIGPAKRERYQIYLIR